MSTEIRIAPANRRPQITDFPVPPARIRLRASRPVDPGRDDLRAARGLLTSLLIGIGLWALLIICWFRAG